MIRFSHQTKKRARKDDLPSDALVAQDFAMDASLPVVAEGTRTFLSLSLSLSFFFSLHVSVSLYVSLSLSPLQWLPQGFCVRVPDDDNSKVTDGDAGPIFIGRVNKADKDATVSKEITTGAKKVVMNVRVCVCVCCVVLFCFLFFVFFRDVNSKCEC